MRSLSTISVAVSALCLCINAEAQTHVLATKRQFRYEDLGAGMVPADINDAGYVVGQSTTTNRAFIYYNGQFSYPDLETAYAINNVGQVLGKRAGLPSIYTISSNQVSWVAPLNYATVSDLNDRGQVSGYDGGPIVAWHGQVHSLNVASTSIIRPLSKINNLGQVAGIFRAYPSASGSAAVYSPNNVSDLSAGFTVTNFGSLSPANSLNFSTAINDAGLVVGYSSGSPFGPYFGWYRALGRSASFQPLGAQYHSVQPLAVNSRNEIVGKFVAPGTASGGGAFLAERNGSFFDLSQFSPPGTLTASANSINGSGHIVGVTRGNNSIGSHGFLLIPISKSKTLGTQEFSNIQASKLSAEAIAVDEW